jgi:hypothetical protein
MVYGSVPLMFGNHGRGETQRTSDERIESVHRFFARPRLFLTHTNCAARAIVIARNSFNLALFQCPPPHFIDAAIGDEFLLAAIADSDNATFVRNCHHSTSPLTNSRR